MSTDIRGHEALHHHQPLPFPTPLFPPPVLPSTLQTICLKILFKRYVGRRIVCRYVCTNVHTDRVVSGVHLVVGHFPLLHKIDRTAL